MKIMKKAKMSCKRWNCGPGIYYNSDSKTHRLHVPHQISNRLSIRKPLNKWLRDSIHCHMEGEISAAVPEGQNRKFAASSPEIVEIKEETEGTAGGGTDVYVAVGKNDLHVVKWALDHALTPGSRLFLVHVFPQITYISTPVGKLSRSQLSKEQAQYYIREESNKRKHMLEKYIQLCNESKVAVDTMLVESNASTKAILELITIANITKLVMGTKQSPLSRLSRKGLGKGEYVQKYAPKSCDVTVIFNDGKKMKTLSSQVGPNTERHFLECVCFSSKSNPSD